jgi:hypothetical protein
MLDLSQDKFITDYVTTFIATWGAEQYHQNAAHAGKTPPPVEDAICMARIAWVHLLDHALIKF